MIPDIDFSSINILGIFALFVTLVGSGTFLVLKSLFSFIADQREHNQELWRQLNEHTREFTAIIKNHLKDSVDAQNKIAESQENTNQAIGRLDATIRDFREEMRSWRP